jgi:hypothetical protein
MGSRRMPKGVHRHVQLEALFALGTIIAGSSKQPALSQRCACGSTAAQGGRSLGI